MGELNWTDLDGVTDAEGHTWTPTTLLRWHEVQTLWGIPIRVLQQAWRRKDTGEFDWRPIETVRGLQ